MWRKFSNSLLAYFDNFSLKIEKYHFLSFLPLIKRKKFFFDNVIEEKDLQ